MFGGVHVLLPRYLAQPRVTQLQSSSLSRLKNPSYSTQAEYFFLSNRLLFPLHHLFFILCGWLKRQEHINQVIVFYNTNPKACSFLGLNSATSDSTLNISCARIA